MINVNEYFSGTVKSLSIENTEGKSTVGVMDAGQYTFGTSSVEYMTVISGQIDVMLPGADNWATYSKGETFRVEAGTEFKLIIKEQAAYHCLYCTQ
jgi:purine/pyrimidine-nucleoside phosphorylase